MKRKVYCVMIALLFVGVTSMKSQVTIGSPNDPHPSAVLDLQSTNKGLLLPNVALSTDLTQFMLNGEVSKATAKGMLVYNTTDNQIYFWNGAIWGLVSGSTGIRVNTNCVGVTFAINLENAPVSACPNTVLPTTMKVTATGGSGNFSYGGDFNADGTLKSGISMPSSGGKALHVVITDVGNACYAVYDFVIPAQTSGCAFAGAPCPSGSYEVSHGVYKQTNPGYITLASGASFGTLVSSFTATTQDLCVYRRDGSIIGPWNDVSSPTSGCVTGGSANVYVDAMDIATGPWRLPNVAELGQLHSTLASYLLTAQPYWTSTEKNATEAWTWYGIYDAGSVFQKTRDLYVRCVRNIN